MTEFMSEVHCVGTCTFPEFTGLRVMMMPIVLDDASSLPDMLGGWRETIRRLWRYLTSEVGVAYVTIDEAFVRKGETHRRPGLHVDGIGPDGRSAAYGGGGGGYGSSGMLLASNEIGCRAWNRPFRGWPGLDGDCEHLREQILEPSLTEHVMLPSLVYRCTGMTVHESLPMERDTYRQFIRLSLPSDAPWHEGYTENPLGVKPTGPILPARAKQMRFRP